MPFSKCWPASQYARKSWPAGSAVATTTAAPSARTATTTPADQTMRPLIGATGYGGGETIRSRGRVKRPQAFSPWYLPLYPSAVAAESRKKTSWATRATPGITRVPHRPVDRDAGAQQAGSGPRQSHEVGWKVDLLAIGDDVRAPVEVPPAVLIGLHVLARRRFADVCGRTEQAR